MAEQLTLSFQWDTLITPLPDGRVILTPGRVQRPAEWVRVGEVQSRTGYSRRQSVRLMHQLGARQGCRGGLLFVRREDLEKYLQRRAADWQAAS